MTKNGKNTRPGSDRASDAVWNRYATILEKESGMELTVSGTGKSEPFASMDYGHELKIKGIALNKFLEQSGVRCAAGGIVPSPLPRYYRTTTKRRARFDKNRFILVSDESGEQTGDSLLEPEQHSAIYGQLTQLLGEKINRPVARALNFAIIRGSYSEFSLIFNVTELTADIVRGCTKTAEKISAAVPLMKSSFIYHDPAGSKYYFDSTQPVDGLRMKRLFGPANLAVRAGGLLYTFHPSGFSQINLSIADDMLSTARVLLDPADGAELLDLYCGYGFFSCYMSRNFAGITGMDYDRNSIEHARANMKRLNPGCRWKYSALKIEPSLLASNLPRGRSGEHMLLDPPRRGTQPGVIETLAERKPVKILHVFCGIETIPAELARWKNCGYSAREIIPLDMFPGTPGLEVMVLLS